MNAAFEKRLAIVWAVLSAITVAQYFILTASGRVAPVPNALLTASVIGVSLVKVRLVLMEFMELRHAPPLLYRLADVWLAVTAACLLGVYFGGKLL